MKKPLLVLGISILAIVFLVNLMPFDTFEIVNPDDVSQVTDIPQQNWGKIKTERIWVVWIPDYLV